MRAGKAPKVRARVEERGGAPLVVEEVDEVELVQPELEVGAVALEERLPVRAGPVECGLEVVLPAR